MRPSTRRRARSAFALSSVLILLAFLAAACGRGDSILSAAVDAPISGDASIAAAPSGPTDAASSTDASQGLFLALAVGNHATAQRAFRYRIRLTGDPEPGPWSTIGAQVDRRVDALDSRDGVTYFSETESVVEDTGQENSFVDLLRQDRSGTYSWQEDLAPTPGTDALRAGVDRFAVARGLDAGSAAALARALSALEAKWAAVGRPIAPIELAPIRTAARPGGVGAHEITLLQYPLHPGATWEGRIGFNRWTVEARERVTVPAGAFSAVRMRIEVAAFGPNDRYATWWAAPGEVAHQAHIEVPATNDQGEIIGTFETEELQQLTAWSPGGGI